ncbi:MAG: hypothetical protein ACRCY9_16770 [Phycicoccus sp.]
MVAIIAGIVSADRLAARDEMNQLIAATEASEQAMATFNATVDAAPWPNDTNGQIDDAAADAMLTQLCGDGAAEVQVAGAVVAEVTALPWHRDLRRAKRDYLAHNRAWDKALSACASSAEAYTDESHSARMDATFRIAARTFEDAIPWPQSPDQAARVEAIFFE